MTNAEMAEYWNARGGAQWVKEKDRYDAMLEPCGRRLLDAAGLKPGEHVLDVGCGNGATTLESARRVGPRGLSVGIDLSGPMIETARRRAGERGIDTARFVQGDAQTAAFDEPFDVAISRFGVMFFDDPRAAFANVARALRPGGRLSFVCWRDMFSNDWIRVPAMAIVAHVGMPEVGDPTTPGPFAFADPDRVREILEAAGLTEVSIEEATDDLAMGSDPEDVIAFMAADEMGRRVLEGKEPEKVQAAMAAAREALEPHAGPEGVKLSGAYWVVRARRP